MPGKLLKSVLDQSSLAYILITADRLEIEYVNFKFKRLVGESNKNYTGLKAASVLSIIFESPDTWDRYLSNSTASHNDCIFAVKLKKDPGSSYIAEISPSEDGYILIGFNENFYDSLILEQLLNSSTDALFVKDVNGIYRHCNQTYADFVGCAISDLIGKSDDELTSKPEAAAYKANDNMALSTGKPVRGERWYTSPDGRKVYASTILTPLYRNSGKPVGLFGISRDMTEQKLAEEKLASSEENFRLFFDTIDDMIFVADKDGKIFHTNGAVIRKLGFKPEQLSNMHVLEVHHPEMRDEAEMIFADMFAGKRDFCPLPLVRTDGTLVPVETRVWFGKWDNNDCIFGISKDLSKEQELLQKFNKIFRNNPALMAISDADTKRFIEVNTSLLGMLGYTEDELIGKTAAELDIFEQPDKQDDVAHELVDEGYVDKKILKLRKKAEKLSSACFRAR